MNKQDRFVSNDTALLFVIVIAVGYLLYVAIEPGSFTFRTIKSSISNELPARVLLWKQMDETARAAARSAGSGNLLANLPDLQSPDGAQRQMASMFYSRAVYALWPRRMFFADSSVVINTSTQMASAARPSGSQWMTDHDIRATVQFRMAKDQVIIERAN